jgi:hypothetical protein
LNIAFWSNANELCQVSANMASISIASVIRYPYSVTLIENRLCNNNLGKAFFDRRSINFIHEAGTNYYDGGGMEGLIRKIYRGNDSKGILKPYILEIITNHLYYIPQSGVIHSEIFDYELNHCIHKLLSMINEYSDFCFIDTASHQNLSTKAILEEADLIVVNLCQKQNLLEDFFLNYSELTERAIFLISSYEPKNRITARALAGKYDIPYENIVPIPTNDGFQNSLLSGNVKEFIRENYSCAKDSPNYTFIQSIKKATYVIIKKAVEQAKEKELLCLT